MKDQILKLRSEGKTYNEIKALLGCSKGSISYHCGEGQKEKSRRRLKRNKDKNPITSRLSHHHSLYRTFDVKSRDFQRREGGALKNQSEHNFTSRDVLKMLGEDVECYLSGEKINIIKDHDYQFDHKIPVSKGGLNILDNLGVLKDTVNKMKHTLSVPEFIEWCKKILEYQGYKVVKEEYLRMA